MLNPWAAFGPAPRVPIPPEMVDLSTLLQYLNMSRAWFRRIRYFRHRLYHTFDITKAAGKTRSISAPDERLKTVQRKISALLETMYRPRNPVHGFVPRRSIKTNAQSHLSGKYILNLDLKDFFPSISEARIVGLLNSLGINSVVSNAIGSLCCNVGELPQGAPSSPILSNMICFSLDKSLMRIAKDARCIYTRYADDITFSSYQPLNSLFEASAPPSGKFNPDVLNAKLLQAIHGSGFQVNPNKAYYADRHARQTVTGLRVNELINVDRRYVRNIRSALHAVHKHGFAAAQLYLGTKYARRSSIGSHLHGKIAWLGHIKGQTDPIYRKLAEAYNALFPASQIKVVATQEQIRERAVWVIEHGTEQGSAFFLKGVGLITAYHCVEGAVDIEIYHPSKHTNTFPVNVVKVCKHRDLALLSHALPATEYFELELSDRNLIVGTALTAAGYPDFGHGDRLSVRPGNISSLPVKSAVRKIEVTQNLPSGMSGGPLLDEEYGVAGVIHWGGPLEDRNLAISRDELIDWLSKP